MYFIRTMIYNILIPNRFFNILGFGIGYFFIFHKINFFNCIYHEIKLKLFYQSIILFLDI